MRRVVAVCLCAALLWGCDESAPAPSEEPEPHPLAVGIAIPSYAHALAWIADDGGHFSDAGLEAEVSVMGGSAASMRALIAGSVDVVLAGGDAAMRANAAGADLVVLAIFVDRFYHRLVAREGITSADDLRGETIGLPFVGGPQDVAVHAALGELGLRYGEDVEVQNLGRQLNRVAALSRGDIDATTSALPPSRLEELGLHTLVDLPALAQRFPYMALVVRRRTLSARRADLSAALGALCDAARAYRSEPDESVRIVRARIGGGEAEALSRERYETSGPSLLALPPTPHAASLTAVRRWLGADAPDVDPAEMIEPGPLAELIAAGRCSP